MMKIEFSCYACGAKITCEMKEPKQDDRVPHISNMGNARSISSTTRHKTITGEITCRCNALFYFRAKPEFIYIESHNERMNRLKRYRNSKGNDDNDNEVWSFCYPQEPC